MIRMDVGFSDVLMRLGMLTVSGFIFGTLTTSTTGSHQAPGSGLDFCPGRIAMPGLRADNPADTRQV
jgi:hypothetical protein